MSKTSEAYTISIVSNIDQFKNLEPVWNDLLRSSGVDNPFLAFEWLYTWWEDFGSNKELHIIVVVVKNRTIGIGPLMLYRIGFFRVMELIGSGISDYLGFITHRNYPKATDEIIKYLCVKKGTWDLINLKDVIEIDRIEKVTGSLSLRTCKRVYEISPFLEILKPWEEFIKSKSKSSKKHIKYNLGKVEKLGNVEIINYSRPGFSGDEFVNQVWDIEKRSWKCEAGTAHFRDEKRRRFLSSIVVQFAQKGWLESLLLKIDEAFVAYSVGFRYNSKIYSYEVGYDQSYPGTGTYLNTHHIMKAFEDGLVEYDFLRGNEAYKLKWTKNYREVYQMVLYKPRSLFSLLGLNLLFKIRWSLSGYDWLHKTILKLLKIKSKLTASMD